MGFFDTIRNKVLPFGAKIAGGIQSIANRISSVGHNALDMISGIPTLGQLASPLLTPLRAGLDIAKSVGDVAGLGKSFLEAPSRDGFNNLATSAGNVARQGRDLIQPKNFTNLNDAIGNAKQGAIAIKKSGLLKRV